MSWLRGFMQNRYGVDKFSQVLSITALVFSVFATLFGSFVLILISYALFGYSIFRMLSRNYYARAAENQKFVNIYYPLESKVKSQFKVVFGTKTHKYYKCNCCKNTLRVPKSRGKIEITCPKCNHRFIKKT